MQTQTPSFRRVLLPVLFALLCTLLTIGAFHTFGGSLPLKPHGYRVHVPVADASNLVQGSDVQSAGVKIGRVVSVTRRGNAADATLELKTPYAPLRQGTTAVARTKTLLGEGYVELGLGPRNARTVPDGGRLSRARVKPTVLLDQFLSTFDPGTRRRTRDLFAGMGEAFGNRGQSTNNTLGRARPFTATLGTVLRTVDAQRADLSEMIDGSGAVLQAVGERQGSLRAAVRAGSDLMGATARRNRELSALVRAAPPFLAQLRRTSRVITAASPDLDRAVTSLEPVAPNVRPTLDQIRAAAPDFRAIFRDLPSTIATGRRSLPAVPSIARAARSGFREFYPTARELIPFMQLFAADRNALYILANVGAVNNGSFVGPGGKVVGYATGLPTVWNETISGWRKKLPTNRQNPYPKPPDALLDTGRIGTLKSYDCRNTHNRLYLPPTGTGAPPCIEQGPWKFNGKIRDYPRLERAPK